MHKRPRGICTDTVLGPAVGNTLESFGTKDATRTRGNGHVTGRLCRAGAALLGTALLLYGCAGTGSAYDERPERLANAAPTAQEIEISLAKEEEALPEVTPVEAPPREARTRARENPPPVPQAVSNPSPVIDESMDIPTEDLHGYPFPGTEELAPRVQAPEPGPADSTEAPKPVALPPAVEEALPATAPQHEPSVMAAALAPGTVDIHADYAPMGPYRIGAGDQLEFQSFNDETINREVTVRYDGYISLPLVADLPVGDLTRAEAERLAREAYAAVFRDPQISLLVREATSKTFTVVGDVERPGRYPYTQAITLIDAISEAGSLRARNTNSSVGGYVGITGQLTKAFIIRNVNGDRTVITYDLRGLGSPGAHSSQAPVYYGDLVYIPEGVNLVYLLGESRNPVIIELTEGMTILQLLALSGGFDASTGRLRGMVLMRQMDDDTTRVMKVNVRAMLKKGTDLPLNPGDILYLPRKRLVRLEEFVRRFTGSISPVLNLYTSAVNAWYAEDIAQISATTARTNNTLRVLGELEQFGASTSNLVGLYGNL